MEDGRDHPWFEFCNQTLTKKSKGSITSIYSKLDFKQYFPVKIRDLNDLFNLIFNLV